MIDNHQRLIIIDGAPYSGTTLLAYLLASHAEVLLARNGPQSPVLENSWLLTQDARGIEAILEASRVAPWLLLKRPWTIYRSAEWLLRELPHAHFLYCVRNEGDVISSWLQPGSAVEDSLQEVMELAHKTYVEAENSASLFSFHVPYFLFVRHEDLLVNPGETLNDIGRWLGRSPFQFTAKEKSKDRSVIALMQVKAGWKECPCTQEDIQNQPGNGTRISELLDLKTTEPLFIIDVGGKWADGHAIALKEILLNRDVHVVEGTENGWIKYEKLVANLEPQLASKLKVWSVARSRLKESEDSLTGRAIVEATETIERINYGLLGDAPATVFGYGKIGRSVARALYDKHVSVGVVEIDPLLAIRAQADGFQLRTSEQAQELGGYIFLATASAIKETGLRLSLLHGLKRDALITFVTSYDDELKESEKFGEAGWLKPVHKARPSENFKQYQYSDPRRVREHLFTSLDYLPETQKVNVYIVNKGSPPNFLFEASCGTYIYLVFFGMLACLHRSFEGEGEHGRINVLRTEDENLIGKVWMKHFVDPRAI